MIKADTVHAMTLLICHTHYTLAQRVTPGLIDITLPDKNFKKICYVYFPIEKTKQAGLMSWTDSIFTLYTWPAREVSAVLF